MPDDPKSGDAKYYRDRAQQIRAAAMGLLDEAARDTMLKVADTYEQMANEIEAKAKANGGPPTNKS